MYRRLSHVTPVTMCLTRSVYVLLITAKLTADDVTRALRDATTVTRTPGPPFTNMV